jgi:hypothetical protein
MANDNLEQSDIEVQAILAADAQNTAAQNLQLLQSSNLVAPKEFTIDQAASTPPDDNEALLPGLLLDVKPSWDSVQAYIDSFSQTRSPVVQSSEAAATIDSKPLTTGNKPWVRWVIIGIGVVLLALLSIRLAKRT